METVNKINRILPEERETHLWYNPNTKTWTMESNIPKHFNKAVKQGWTVDHKFINEEGSVIAMQLSAAERAITIKTPVKRKSNNNGFKTKNSGFNEDFED